MIRINRAFIMSVAVAAISYSGIVLSAEAPATTPAPASHEAKANEILCILPETVKGNTAKPNIKKMTAEECKKVGGKVAPKVEAAHGHGRPAPMHKGKEAAPAPKVETAPATQTEAAPAAKTEEAPAAPKS